MIHLQSTLPQHLLQILVELDITVLSALQQLDLKNARTTRLMSQAGFLGLLVSDAKLCRLSITTSTEGSSEGMIQCVLDLRGHRNTHCSGCHLSHGAWLPGHNSRLANSRW